MCSDLEDDHWKKALIAVPFDDRFQTVILMLRSRKPSPSDIALTSYKSSATHNESTSMFVLSEVLCSANDCGRRCQKCSTRGTCRTVIVECDFNTPSLRLFDLVSRGHRSSRMCRAFVGSFFALCKEVFHPASCTSTFPILVHETHPFLVIVQLDRFQSKCRRCRPLCPDTIFFVCNSQ